MQYIGNDMDDLFRQAAERYPLNSGSSDWEKVYSQLTEKDKRDPILVPVASNGGRSLKYLWLLLLVPIGLLVAKFTGNISNEQAQNQAGIKQQSAEKTMPLPNGNQNVLPDGQNNKPTSQNNSAGVQAAGNAGRGVHDFSDAKNNTPVNTVNTSRIADLKELKNKEIINRQPENVYSAPVQGNQENKAPPQAPTDLSNQNQLLITNTVPEVSANAAATESAMPAASKQLIKLQKPKKFYAGVIVAPDFTTVKFQSVKKMGLNFGVLMGYQVNSKINAELGVLLDSKYYYTDGKYLDSNAIKKDVVNLNGFSSITEIPINIRYNFKTNRSSQYFASVGAVSYIIHNQKYNYVYDKNGTLLQGEKQINKASSNWFSNMQISVGYEHQLGKLGDFRVEPYYRIPIKGVGIGNLPITSVGINIGITRKIK